MVNTVVAVFPFGTPEFVKLRHEMWLRVFEEAAKLGRSLIFTFTPESSVPQTFIDELQIAWTGRGGTIIFVKLQVSDDEQERRIESPDRKVVGKLSSLDTLRRLRAQGVQHGLVIPVDLLVNTEVRPPEATADLIMETFHLPISETYIPFP